MKKEIIIAVVVTIIAFLLVHFQSLGAEEGGGVRFDLAIGVPVGMLWGSIYFSEKNGGGK